jgi:nucleotide-binding universal stress UspA family protein
MTERVLVPIDDTELTEDVLQYAFDHHPDADLTALHVATTAADAPLEITGGASDDQPDYLPPLFERVDALAAEHDRHVETVTVFGSPARSILEYAENEDVDAIVLGSHGRHGVERLLLGSVAETVTRRASVSVTVVR